MWIVWAYKEILLIKVDDMTGMMFSNLYILFFDSTGLTRLIYYPQPTYYVLFTCDPMNLKLHNDLGRYLSFIMAD